MDSPLRSPRCSRCISWGSPACSCRDRPATRRPAFKSIIRNRAAYRRVRRGCPSRIRCSPAFHADLAANRPVHHDERARHVGGGLHAVQVEVGGRKAPTSPRGRRARIPSCSPAITMLIARTSLVRLPQRGGTRHSMRVLIAAQGRDGGVYLLGRGRDDGKPVRESLFKVVLHQIDFLVHYLRRLRHAESLLLVESQEKPIINRFPQKKKTGWGRGRNRNVFEITFSRHPERAFPRP